MSGYLALKNRDASAVKRTTGQGGTSMIRSGACAMIVAGVLGVIRSRAGDAVAAGQARGGRHVLGAARRDRQDPQRRYCARPHPGRGRRDRAARQARLLRGVRLPRQGGRRADDDRHDLQHRLHDQADGGGRRAAALRAGQAPDGRSAREIFSEIRRHEGRGDGRQGRDHRRHGAGGAQDHDPGPDRATPPG